MNPLTKFSTDELAPYIPCPLATSDFDSMVNLASGFEIAKRLARGHDLFIHTSSQFEPEQIITWIEQFIIDANGTPRDHLEYKYDSILFGLMLILNDHKQIGQLRDLCVKIIDIPNLFWARQFANHFICGTHDD